MEGISNFGETFLSSTVNSSATTITLNSLTGFPSTYPFRLTIDKEVMLATASPGGTSLTVTRGYEGSAAASHTAGQIVLAAITAGGLVQQILDRQPTSSTVTIGNHNVTAASNTWVDLRDQSTLAYAELTLTAGRYLLLVTSSTAQAVSGSGSTAAAMYARIRDTLGTSWSAEPFLNSTSTAGVYSSVTGTFTALATLTATRTLRVQGKRYDFGLGITWSDSTFGPTVFTAVRLGD